MLLSTIEDVGVTAFKGQIENLAGTSVLSAALQIHSVAARHASTVRSFVGKSDSEGAFDKPMSKNEVLEAVKPFFRLISSGPCELRSLCRSHRRYICPPQRL